MNLPNKLTVARFGLTVVFLWVLFWPWAVPFRHTWALLFFCLAGITDFWTAALPARATSSPISGS